MKSQRSEAKQWKHTSSFFLTCVKMIIITKETYKNNDIEVIVDDNSIYGWMKSI